MLVVARLPGAALVLERHGGEAVAPFVRLGENVGPKFVRRRIALDIALRAGLHVDLVDAPAIGGIGKARLQLLGIGLGLPNAFGVALVARLGLDHRQLVIADTSARSRRFLACRVGRRLRCARGRYLAADPAIGDDAPTRRLQRGVDQFGAGLGLVHSAASLIACDGGEVSSPEKAFCRMDCLSSARFELLLVDASRRWVSRASASSLLTICSARSTAAMDVRLS